MQASPVIAGSQMRSAGVGPRARGNRASARGNSALRTWEQGPPPHARGNRAPLTWEQGPQVLKLLQKVHRRGATQPVTTGGPACAGLAIPEHCLGLGLSDLSMQTILADM